MRSHSKTIRWGIIGCGNVTERKSGPAFKKVSGSDLVAVMRRNRELLLSYAKRHNVPKYYLDADKLIEAPDIDAVYIATPPSTHRYYALKVAQAKKVCCVEKPMALNFAECVDMQNAFDHAGMPLFVSYYRRSLPRFKQIKEWLQTGAIGNVRHVHWDFSRAPTPNDLSREPNWRTQPSISGGGYFVDLASHGLDLFIYLMGDVAEVHGVTHNQQDLYEAEDAVSACWKFRSGATGSGFWNFASFRRNDKVTIYGSKGEIVFSIFVDLPLRLHNAAGERSVYIDNPENIQIDHIENIMRHLRGEGEHPSLGRDAMKTSQMIDQILGQLLRGSRDLVASVNANRAD